MDPTDREFIRKLLKRELEMGNLTNMQRRIAEDYLIFTADPYDLLGPESKQEREEEE